MTWFPINSWTRALGLGLATAFLAAAAWQDTAAKGDLDTLERSLTDAWASGETSEIGASAERISAFVEAHPGSARAHYLSGLCSLIRGLRTNGSPDRSDVERTLGLLDTAEESLARAFELDASEADACAASAFCILQRFILGEGGPELGRNMVEWAQRAQSAGPERSSVRLVTLWLGAGRAMTSPEAIDRIQARFIGLAETIRGDLEEEQRSPDFWDLFGQCMAARLLLIGQRPQPRQAVALVEALRAQRPGLPMVEKVLVPLITVHEPLAPATWREVEWEEIGAEPDPDGSTPGLADGAAVFVGVEGDFLWLRIQLHDPPNADLFGINVVIDADASDETGSPWWGGDSSFVFDRLVSVSVARDDQGDYRGAVGLTDDAGAMQGELTNLGDGGVGFAVDLEGKAFVLRMARNALGGETARFLVAVGSNAQWNDNLLNEGSFVLGH